MRGLRLRHHGAVAQGDRQFVAHMHVARVVDHMAAGVLQHCVAAVERRLRAQRGQRGLELAQRAESLLADVRARLDAAQAQQAQTASTAGTQENLQ